MIGRFGLGNKNSPSREHRNPAQPASADVSTQTHALSASTNFFSLPLWRRRTPHSSTTEPAHSADTSFDDFGTPARRASSNALLRERSPASVDTGGDSYRHSSPWLSISDDDDAQPRAGPSTLPEGRLSSASSKGRPKQDDSLHPSHSTIALARAALGLGLPHAGRTSSSSPSDTNSIPFVPESAGFRSSHSVLRSSRSLHKLTPNPSSEDLSDTPRSRGISMGPTYSVAGGKGKERQHETGNSVTPPVLKTVSRRPSFWRRNRNDSSKATTPDSLKNTPPLPEASFDTERVPRSQPSLPTLRPLSPFDVDTSIPIPHSLSARLSTATSHSNLQRCHSERLPSLTRKEPDSGPSIEKLPPQPNRRRKPKRPATADPVAERSPFLPATPAVSFSRRRTLSRPSTADPSSLPAASPVPSTQSTRVSPVMERSETLPAEAIRPRPRAQTNPHLFHRLSLNLFASSTPPPQQRPLPPVIPISPTPLTSSPAGSSFSSPRPSTSKNSVEIPKPLIDEESPDHYVHRLSEAVNKADIASVLASSSDEFYAQALRIYIARFNFTDDPLDVALRKILMHVGLPRETQQIDRVIEAFASRYSQCNPDLFAPHDHTYILAFSLIMLHTDAFNKSNKRKMSKADYLKNTSLPGVAPEVLDCFYDNIVFAPFIFIEDPFDAPKERSLTIDGGLTARISSLSVASVNNSGATLLGKAPRIDPYYLIIRNELGHLRVVGGSGFLDDPYSYELPGEPMDIEAIHADFVQAVSIEVNMDNHMVSPAFFSIPSPMVGGSPMGMSPDLASGSTIWAVKVIKYGLLSRKDDMVEGGKKAINRKWKDWGVILTGSQLLLYRDPAWCLSVLARLHDSEESLPTTHVTLLRPDELLPIKDAIAVRDDSYAKREHTLRLSMRDGRQYLFQTSNDVEAFNWMARINYASAFKTAEVRIRSGGMSTKDVELTGIAAATSHLREMEQRNKASPDTRVRSWHMSNANSVQGRRSSRADSLSGPTAWRQSSIDIEPGSPQSESSSLQLKATFDQVKVDLAGGLCKSLDNNPPTPPRGYSLDLPSIHSPESVAHVQPSTRHQSSRTRAIKQRIVELDVKISEAQSQIDSDLRFLRNVAILTPFQRTTRDRLQVAYNNVAKKILQARLEAVKLVCHREILAGDLIAADHKWNQTKETALNAAREMLQSHVANLDAAASRRPLPPISVSNSTEDVFYSALDHRDSPVELSSRLPTSLEVHNFVASPSHTPVTEASSSAGSFPFHGENEDGRSSAERESERRSQSGHERFYTAPEVPEEEAEEWNKTRAAKRVSLVQVPASLKMSLLLKPRSPDGGSGSSPSSPHGLWSSGTRPAGILETVTALDI